MVSSNSIALLNHHAETQKQTVVSVIPAFPESDSTYFHSLIKPATRLLPLPDKSGY